MMKLLMIVIIVAIIVMIVVHVGLIDVGSLERGT